MPLLHFPIAGAEKKVSIHFQNNKKNTLKNPSMLHCTLVPVFPSESFQSALKTT